MSGKSRHGKGKRSFRSKREKIKQHSPALAMPQPAAAQPRQPVPPPRPSIPSVSAPTPKAAPTTARYQYITAELRRTGVLAGIVLAILIVLAFVLP